MLSNQLVLRTDCPLSCPSETGTGSGTGTERGTKTGSGNEKERQEFVICGQSERKRCCAGREPVASGSGTGIRFGSLQDLGKMDDGLGPGTGKGDEGRGPRARRGRLTRRVMHTFT